MNFKALSAKQLFDNGVKPSNIRPIARALWALFKKLIIKEEYFKAEMGLKVAFTTMFNTYLKYIKLNDLYKTSSYG